MDTKFRIVCLCGSAGALSAYVEILKSMPEDTGMAFLLLTHRRLGTPCWLPQIMARTTRMSVLEVVNGTVMAPNTVYIIPAGADMTTDGNSLSLVPSSSPRGWPDTFDIFLKSLAYATHSRAVAVILSGMAGDGSSALGAIRTSGGVTFAQTHADYQSMPDTAIETGKVDFIGTAGEISVLLARLTGRPHLQTGSQLAVSGIDA